ncbi:rho GTPase activation protein, PH domain-like, Ternary complex factor MIP1, leucine-zipper [Artemisia annua]|uniref:Rho GTPase activation protein, PH domain-like, Ternary complex factor MIP1, leucine-zipper n=1 Tax=Artemisia annua TaxID=35608 RepID=A0A2U1MDH2_ARTAN|nr:rho GTPase activation protein, PH domain-like, Ternary complex factor MIP1, leucine-zipper [Artemisia annua]
MKKVIWYVLHNSPEIDAYMNEFQSEHPESDMQQEFPRWFESKFPPTSSSSHIVAVSVTGDYKFEVFFWANFGLLVVGWSYDLLQVNSKIPWLETLKADLAKKIESETRHNSILKEELLTKKDALGDRHIALEQEVATLKEQLQKERELRKILEAGLMMSKKILPLPGSIDDELMMRYFAARGDNLYLSTYIGRFLLKCTFKVAGHLLNTIEACAINTCHHVPAALLRVDGLAAIRGEEGGWAVKRL